MTINACKICKSSVLNEGICLGLAINKDLSKIKPIEWGSSLLENWLVENSVHDAKIEENNCNCQYFVKTE
mgnify:CR=1 FL=1